MLEIQLQNSWNTTGQNMISYIQSGIIDIPVHIPIFIPLYSVYGFLFNMWYIYSRQAILQYCIDAYAAT